MIGSLCLLCLAWGGQDDATAPPATWYTRGGNAARTRVTASAGLDESPVLAWSHSFPFEVVDEPLLWGDHAVLETSSGSGTRRLHLIDVRDGALLGEPLELASATPLEPTLWGEHVYYRAGGSRLGVAARSGGGFASPRQHDLEGELGAPLVFEDTLFVPVGDEVRAYGVERMNLLWKVDSKAWGRLSLRGEELAWRTRSARGLEAVAFAARSTGRLAREVVPIGAAFTEPGTNTVSFVALFSDCALIYSTQVLAKLTRGSTRTLGFPISMRGTGDSVEGRFLYHQVPPAELGAEMLQFVQDGGSPGWRRATREGHVPLASRETHPDWSWSPKPPSVAGRLAYLGSVAVDPVSRRVLWRLPEEEIRALVPFSHGVLSVHQNGRQIDAWKPEGSFGPAASGSFEGELPDQALEARVVMNDGTVEEGVFEHEDQTLVQVRKAGSSRDLRKRVVHEMADVALVLDQSEVVRFARSPASLLRGLDRLLGTSLAEAYADLATRAIPAKDYGLVRELTDRALELGASERDLRRPLSWLERKATETLRVDEERRAAVLERRLEVEATRSERLVDYAAALPAESSALRKILLQPVLEHAPEHERARALVPALPRDLQVQLLGELLEARPGDPRLVSWLRAELPESLRPQLTPETAGEWSAFLRATERSAVQIIEPPETKVDLTLEQRKLGEATLHWRKDLVGFASESLFLLTPRGRPGAVARALALGELVCQFLETIFAEAGENVRDGRFRLIVYLYESEQEYLEQSTRFGGSAEALSWTAGHYDPQANVSRIYIPEGDQALEDVLEVFAHELTHHWIRARCPLFTNEQAVQALYASKRPGYWIVEGFASMVEEFAFDVDDWSWEPTPPHAHRMQVVNVAPEHLSWNTLFVLDQVLAKSLPKSVGFSVPVPTRLGVRFRVTPISLFYAQSAAASAFLFSGDDGAHRKALLEYLAAYYRGESGSLDFKKTFGMNYQELGRRALEWARQTTAGG